MLNLISDFTAQFHLTDVAPASWYHAPVRLYEHNGSCTSSTTTTSTVAPVSLYEQSTVAHASCTSTAVLAATARTSLLQDERTIRKQKTRYQTRSTWLMYPNKIYSVHSGLCKLVRAPWLMHITRTYHEHSGSRTSIKIVRAQWLR